jgi:HEAT repeat protein
VKRLNEVGGGDQKVLEAIARTDPYEEIRAAALRALGLKGEQAGARVLREVLAVALDVRNWQRFEGDALMTLRELGREAEPVLLAMLQGEDQTDRTRAAAIIAGCSWPVGGNVLRDALIPLLPLLKALNSTNVGIVNAIADIERKV